jgi:phosphopantetheinyl transferase (holo-ACP synthase)
MLGNDVIDLGDPEARPGALHPRFDARVFTREEQAELAREGSPERLRWRLWAAKEAAYKCVRKLDPAVHFAPARFAVSCDGDGRGSVEHAGRRLRVAWWEEGEAVHALATDGADPERALMHAVATLPAAASGGPACASAAVRALALDAVARHLGCAVSELAIVDAGRVPRVHRRGVPLDLDLSLSHHGRLVAFAVETLPRGGAR